jgi:hypothetical protein
MRLGRSRREGLGTKKRRTVVNRAVTARRVEAKTLSGANEVVRHEAICGPHEGFGAAKVRTKLAKLRRNATRRDARKVDQPPAAPGRSGACAGCAGDAEIILVTDDFVASVRSRTRFGSSGLNP